MPILKKLFLSFIIFMSGGIAFANIGILTGVIYEYDAGWHKVFLSVMFGILFSIFICEDNS